MVRSLRNTVAKVVKESRPLRRYSKLYNQFKEYTMVKQPEYISSIDLADKFRHVPGSVVECGVWRGGMIAGIASLLGNDRKYFLFDSFEGLPPAGELDGEDAVKYQEDKLSPFYFDNCKAEKEWAEKAMQLSGARDYTLIKGWFNETLPGFTMNEPIAILRLDADWYDSTMCCLANLYPKVAKGGVIIFDDYYTWEGCSRALHDYLSANKLTDRIYQLSEHACYLVKMN